MMNATRRGRPDAGNPYVRFDEGEVASENPRRGSLHYKRIVMMTGLALGTATAFGATERSLTQNNGAWTDELLTNSLIWTGRNVPVNGEQATLRLGGDLGELRISLDADLTNAFWQVLHAAGNGTAITFDGNGHDVTPPTLDSAGAMSYNTDNNVFWFQPYHGLSYGKYFCVQNKDSYSAPFKLTNPLYRYCVTNGVAELDFKRGTYNVYDADGTGSTSRYIYFGGDPSKIPTVIKLSSGTSWHVGNVDSRANGVSNAVIIAGADLYDYGGWSSYYATSANAQYDDVTITDNATVTIAGTLQYTVWHPNGEKYAAIHRFKVEDGATLKLKGGVSLDVKKMTFAVNDATWDMSDNSQGKLTLFTTTDSGDDCVAVTNSTVSFKDQYVRFGQEDATAAALPVTIADSRVSMERASIEFRRTEADFEGTCVESTYASGGAVKAQYGSTVAFTDCTLSNLLLQCGYCSSATTESGSTLTVKGGNHWLSRFEIGKAETTGAGESVIRILGAAVTLFGNGGSGTPSPSYSRTDIGCKSPAALELKDGAIVTAAHINGGDNGTKSGDATARLTMDGAKLVCGGTDANAWIRALDVAEVGAKGAVLDTNGYDPTLSQDFTDATGVAGTLIKAGAGTLTMSVADYSVSTTVVAQGSLTIAQSADDGLNTVLVATNGTTLTLADGKATSFTLKGLDIENATLVLDTNDTVVVDGPAVFRNLTIRYAQTLTSACSLLCMTINGAIDAESQSALRRAICDNEIPDGTHTRLEATYDETTKTWSVKFHVRADVSPLSATTTWSGPDWGSDASWSAGVPTAEKIAVFPNDSVVTVPAGAFVGALRFTGSATLTGAELEIASEQGAAAIEATAGTSVLECPLVMNGSRVPVTIAADASLALNGAVTYGTFTKTGDGAFTLGVANELRLATSFTGGFTTLGDANSLNGATSITLGGGTLETKASATLPKATIAPTDATKPQIIKTDVDTAMGPMDVTGAFLKRGAGKLTIDYTGEKTSYTLSTLKTDGTASDGGKIGLPHDPNNPYSFPADGSAPADGFEGFTVAEGELVIKGDSTQHNIKGSVLVGMYTPDGTVQPTLTFDGANIRHYGYGALMTGLHAGATNGFVTSPTIRVINGASLVLESTRFAYGSKAGDNFNVTLAMTNGTSWAISQQVWSDSPDADHPVKIRAKDSAFHAAGSTGHCIMGAVDADFDGTIIGQNSGGEIGGINLDSSKAQGVVVIRNGSRFRINCISVSQLSKDISFVFDDASWEWGTGDFTFSIGAKVDREKLRFVMRGKGVKFAPASSETVTINYPFTGEGGCQLTGAGTLVFGPGAYQFTGPLCAVAGTVDLSNAGTITNACFGVGAGQIVGATTTEKVTLALEAEDDWSIAAAPTLSECGLENVTRVFVDFGRTAANPLSEVLPGTMTIGTFTGGTKPPANAFRLRGTGLKGYRGVFSYDGDTLKMSVELQCGTTFLIR